MSDLPREVIAFPERRKTAASKKRVDEMAQAAIFNIDRIQQVQDEKNEEERRRKILERELEMTCLKAYAWFPQEKADEILINMLPWVQTKVKLKRS